MMSNDVNFLLCSTMINHWLGRSDQSQSSNLCYNEIWSSRFHLSTVSRTRHHLETHKALKLGPDRSLSTTKFFPPAGEGDSLSVSSTSDIRENWKLCHDMKDQRLTILFVRSTLMRTCYSRETTPAKLSLDLDFTSFLGGKHLCQSLQVSV